jgi:hypothetical protein
MGSCVFCCVIRSVLCLNCSLKNVSQQFINLPLGQCFNNCNVYVACPYCDCGLIYVVRMLIVVCYYVRVCTQCVPCSVFLFLGPTAPHIHHCRMRILSDKFTQSGIDTQPSSLIGKETP